MRYLIVVFLLLSVFGLYVAHASSTGSVHYIIIGKPGCSYTIEQENFFEEQGYNYTLCPTTHSMCQKALGILVGRYNLTLMIPTTLVIKNSTVVAIVQGVVKNSEFWENISDTVPSSNVTDVYEGTNFTKTITLNPSDEELLLSLERNQGYNITLISIVVAMIIVMHFSIKMLQG